MGKSRDFTGQPIFNQLLSLIPRSLVKRLVRAHGSDYRCKKFKSYDHVVTMLFCCFHQCNSIREVITGMQACSHRLLHLGLKHSPRRSTLSDANERRGADFFQALYHHLYAHYYGGVADSLKGRSVDERLFIIDSTIVTLFSTVLQSTGSFGLNGKKKGGIKAHVLMRSRDQLPCFVQLCEGKQNDNQLLSLLSLPKGSIVVMDKGYHKYQQFRQWSEQQISWVTRLNERAVYQPLKRRRLSKRQKQLGVRKDQIIALGGKKTRHINPVQQVRLITFYDKTSQRAFRFLTNNFTYSAATIADIYKKRWQIELLFKRLKQNFQLRYFLGDNENAIRIQLWSALIADLLIKIVKDKVAKKRAWSLSNLASFIKIHLGTYINLKSFLDHPEKALLHYQDPQLQLQLLLFQGQPRGA